MVHCLMPAAAWDYFLRCEHAPLLSQAMVCDRQARTHPLIVTHKTLFLNLIINQVLLLFLRQTLDLQLFDLIWTKPVFKRTPRKDASWLQNIEMWKYFICRLFCATQGTAMLIQLYQRRAEKECPTLPHKVC